MAIFERFSYFIVIVGVIAAVSGCASTGPFVVQTDSQYLRVALEKERITKRAAVSFAVTADSAESRITLSTAPLRGGIFDKKYFVVMPSAMMSNVVSALVEAPTASESSLTLTLKLIRYDYDRLEYGFGTSQPEVWLTIGTTLSDHKKVVSENTYISRAQCGPPFSTWGFWESGKEAPAGYAVATYQALIIAIEQAINQKAKPIDQLRDPQCITYTKNDTWDLNSGGRK